MLDLLDIDIEKISRVESICKKHFRIDLQIENIILDAVPTSNNSHTSIFKTKRNQVYALCVSAEPLTLADVKNIVKSMGMKAEIYLPPNADRDYFLRCGRNIYKSVFPGREAKTDADTKFYQTFTTYNPALVMIAEVSGEIRQYNKIWRQWQKSLEYSYLRMQVR